MEAKVFQDLIVKEAEIERKEKEDLIRVRKRAEEKQRIIHLKNAKMEMLAHERERQIEEEHHRRLMDKLRKE